MGPDSADVFLLGEAPGEEEDRAGKPFVGKSGQLLGRLVAGAGIDRSRLFLSNTARCHPPNNRDPLLGELDACQHWTEEQLAIIRPKLVVTLGRFAAARSFHGLPMAEVHGRLTRHEGQLHYGLYHPAAALHNPSLRKRINEGFSLLGEIVKKL
jgi:uracil-DNA glycosylase